MEPQSSEDTKKQKHEPAEMQKLKFFELTEDMSLNWELKYFLFANRNVHAHNTSCKQRAIEMAIWPSQLS